MFNINYLFLLSLAIAGAWCEIKFVTVFTAIASGDEVKFMIYEYILATLAPMCYLVYYFGAFEASIKFCNNILIKLSLGDDFYNKDNSINKQLNEDYIICREQLSFPALLMVYRVIIIVVLLYQGFLLLHAEIGNLIYLSLFMFVLVFLLAKIIVSLLSRSFAQIQTERSKIVDRVIGAADRTECLTDSIKKIANLNRKVYFRRMLVNSMGALSKPIVDFVMMCLIVMSTFGGFAENVDGGVVVGLGLIFYRSAGPLLTLLNGVNQIQFGWQALSPSWKRIIRLEKEK
ncbi:hypothetical protein N9W92_01035 [Planktomarina temperata]|nr:hypothetical protein [Planktomarina temperata]MDB2459789.1 hypothetical protein [Planktomarina temperata]